MSVALQTAFCHACRSDVIPRDGRCPWCETELLVMELPAIARAERVSIDPFVAWSMEERGRLLTAARERGERIHNNDRGGRKLLDELEITPATWMQLCRSSLIAVERVTELLARAGVRFEEVYGSEPEVAWGNGQRRRRRVEPAVRVTPLPTPGEAGWEPIERPDDAYKPTCAVARHGAGRDRYLTEEELRFAAEAYLSVPTIKFAAEDVQRRYGLCGYSSPMALYQGIQRAFRVAGWLKDREKMHRDLQAGQMPAPQKRRRPYQRRSRVPEWLVFEAAYRYYWDQWGFQRLGRYFYPRVRTLYKQPSQLEQAIYTEFKHRGWPRRDRVEATRIASFKHGLAARDRYTRPREEGEGPYRSWLRHQRGLVRPQCEGTAKTSGERCKRAAAAGAKYCPQHDPEKQAEVTAHMKRMRAASHASMEVPVEPFAVWLEHKRAEFPTQKAMAEVVAAAGKWTTAQAMIAHVLHRRRPTIRRATVERVLLALGGDSEFERGLRQASADATGLPVSSQRVTFEDLYGPYIRSNDA